MGGHHVPERGPNDDGYNEEGYDESQRAEILEATRDGPTDGIVLTDVEPDLGDDDDDDDLEMLSDEIGEEDGDAESDADDIDEDEQQADFDDGTTADEEDLDDRDKVVLEP